MTTDIGKNAKYPSVFADRSYVLCIEPRDNEYKALLLKEGEKR